MSTLEDLRATLDEAWTVGKRIRIAGTRTVVLRTFFGDHRGLALFFGALCFFMVYWRVGVFITDSNVFVNTLVNVADGRLALQEAPYGEGLQAPGTYRSDGRAYGRNYGVVYLAVPVLAGIEAVTSVVDPRMLLVATWSLLVLGFGVSLAEDTGFGGLAVAGSLLAVLAYLGNAAVATPLAPALYPVLALQTVTMVAAAFCGVFVYRLVARVHGRQVGVAAGVATVAATPIGFWASLPKRHSFTVLLLVVTAYALYRSRTAESPDRARTFRALAYVPVGAMATIHAAEALLLLVALVTVDVPTAKDNGVRSLATVGLALFLSLVPFLVTNTLIAGDPLQAPRMLPAYDQVSQAQLDMSGSTSAGGGVTGEGAPRGLVGRAIEVPLVFLSLLLEGITVGLSSPDRLYQTFVRSGYIESVASQESYETLSMTVLEAGPLTAALVGVPVVVGKQLLDDASTAVAEYRTQPVAAVDAFVVCYTLLLVCIYIPKLPLFAQVTVRYLHPLFVVGIYGAVRLAAVRDVLEDHWRTALWSYGGTVLIGGQLVVVALAVLDPGIGEAIQFHALLGLSVALVLAVWTVVGVLRERPGQFGAATIGLTAGVSTVFLLLSGLDYFDYAGEFALPVVRAVAEAVTLV